MQLINVKQRCCWYFLRSPKKVQQSSQSFQAENDIKVIDAALGGWQGSGWSGYLERYAAPGTILIEPTPEQVEILKLARQWVLDNGKGIRYGWCDTDLGKQHNRWVESKVIRYAESAANQYLKGYKLPKGLYLENYTTIGIVFNDETTFQNGGCQFACAAKGIVASETGTQVDISLTDSEGQTIDDGKQCWLGYDSKLSPNATGKEARKYYESILTHVKVHEVIHALGQKCHDVDFEGNNYFLVTAQPAPTPGAHPDISEWFHCAPIHTMLTKGPRLGK